MPLKKTDLYASLWASCDELRGGMDASQYKDYVLFMLFIKYISDKYADDDDFPPVTIPKGSSFKDMVALKGQIDIGDRINKQIIQPLIEANKKIARSDFPDFNDPTKLGEGQAMVDRLGNLIAIFEKPELDFSKNHAENDDILGDAYEYLMRHFATQSGKSKGQFYTPAEVSRVIAQLLGITPENATSKTSAYDPTCGSGSLLLKVAAQAGKSITLEGQEMDVTTAGLARMNMILHDFPSASILQGNTLAAPKFLDVDEKTGAQQLRTYDYVVANPPFSDKAWSTGIDPEKDPYGRFAWGAPPPKQGDYAYLLHIIRSMNSTGKAACILPHGVLFRGNAEGVIRKKLIESGILKAIIGLPANIFYGTGIPACILVLDKENAQARKGIYIIDAAKGFMKDGAKNRLREQDIHKIVDAFRKLADIAGFARMVSHTEIADDKNGYNLNLPRYIDSSAAPDWHDIQAHLMGGIPERDVDALSDYWRELPSLRGVLFENDRPGYVQLRHAAADIGDIVRAHAEFAAFANKARQTFEAWQHAAEPQFKALGSSTSSSPRALMRSLSEDLLARFAPLPLMDAYALYQHFMDFWAATLQDDCHHVAARGWTAKPERMVETGKNGKTKDKGWVCELLPKSLIVAQYFAADAQALQDTRARLEATSAELAQLQEEHSAEDCALSGFDKLTPAAINSRMAEIGDGDGDAEEKAVLQQWLELHKQEAQLKKTLKDQDTALDKKAFDQYAQLSEGDIQTLLIAHKWLPPLQAALDGELERITQTLTQRTRELHERYARPLSAIEQEVQTLSARVQAHLKTMGAL